MYAIDAHTMKLRSETMNIYENSKYYLVRLHTVSVVSGRIESAMKVVDSLVNSIDEILAEDKRAGHWQEWSENAIIVERDTMWQLNRGKDLVLVDVVAGNQMASFLAASIFAIKLAKMSNCLAPVSVVFNDIPVMVTPEDDSEDVLRRYTKMCWISGVERAFAKARTLSRFGL